MKSLLTVVMILLLANTASAQTPGYDLILKNDSVVSTTTYEFDIFLDRSDFITFELASLQPIMTFNTGISSGAVTLSMNAGTSQLNAAQQPTTMSVVGNELRINPRVPPGAGAGTVIPAAPGLRVGRFRLTSTVPFNDQPANIQWNNSTNPLTKVFAYVAATNTDITDSASHLNQLTNPTLLPATQVVFIQQPTNDVAGATITPAITVQLRNGLGADVSESGVPITLALTTGTGTLGGTLTVNTNGSGLATFSNISINLAGSKNLTASSAGLSSAVSSSFTIAVGSASTLAFVQQPTSAVAGANISPTITVQVRDAFGNDVSSSGVSVEMDISSGTGALGGNVSRNTNGAGQAMFNNLTIDLAGAKNLTASASGLSSAVSASFTISAAAVNGVAFVQQPTNAAAGAALAPAVTVQLLDQFGNSVPASGTSIGLSITTGTGTLSGTASQPTNGSGLATFSNLSINLAGSKNLTAASAGLTSAISSSFTISAGAATQVVFVQQPTNRTAGAAISPSITAQVQDALGNNIAGAGVPVTLDLSAGTGTLGGTLAQGTNAGGLATFGDITIDLAGSKNLTASSPGLSSAVSNAFTISAATLSRVVFIQEPSNATAGATIAPAVTVQLQDNFGNNIATGGTSIALSLTSGTGTLSGTTPQTTSGSGLATFNNLSINLAGPKNLTATSTGLASDVSAPFTIATGTASRVAFIQQPSNAAAGVTISPEINVQLQDALGNPVASPGVSVTLSLSTGTGTLAGTLLQNTDGDGVATFDNISIALSGSKNITASSAGMTSAISSAFTIAPAAANQLVFIQQPANAAAGASIAPAITVRLRDQFGNDVLTSGTSVAMTLSSGTGALSGTTPQLTNASGVATFSNLSVNLTGVKAVTASSAGLTSAVSASFAISAGGATQLAFIQQPTDATAGVSISPAVTVQIRDALGNDVASGGVSVTMSLSSGSGTLGGTATQLTNGSGLATFSNLSVNLAGSKNITASSGGLTPAQSSAFTILPAAGSQLAFVQQPTSATSNTAIDPPVSIQVRDAFGNDVAAAGVNVTVSLFSGTGALSGTLMQPTSPAGLATFGDLSINASGLKVLNAAASGLSTTQSSSFSILSGSPTKVVFSVQPTNASAGAAISPSVAVQLQDASNNAVPSAGVSITVALSTGTGTLGGTLTRVTDAGGLAVFNDLSVDLAGSKNLTATSGVLTSAVSSAFTIAPAAATQVQFTQQPTSAAAGATITPAVTVQLRDNFGNNVLSSGISVTLSISTGSGTLSGTTSQSTNGSGVASFGNLSINLAGSKNLTASSLGLSNAVSSAFTISAGSASRVAFVQQPGGAGAGATISPAVTVQLEDALGNPVATSGVSITMSLSSGTGALSGTTTRTTSGAGLATFDDLSVNLTGSKNITAASTGLTSAVSGAFTIGAAAATQVAFAQQPTSATAGVSIAPAVTVQLRDNFGNNVATSGVIVTMTLASGAGTLSGTTTQLTNGSGLATFSNLSVDLTGAKTLGAASTGLTSATSGTLTIFAAPASDLIFVQQPSSALPGAAIAPAVTVQIQDNFGNNISANGVSITMVLSSGTGALSGTTTRTTNASGLATFNDLSINLTGIKAITASSSGLTAAVSNTFTISAGTATIVRVETAADGSGVVVPSQSVTAGNAITVFAISRDGSGNFVANVAADVWSIQSATGGIVAGDLVPNVDLRSAVFTGHLVGTTQLRATSGALAPVNSGTITVTASGAYQLGFVQQPSNGIAGAFIAPPITVQVRDFFGNNVSGAGVPVSMALNSGTGSITGTTTQNTNAAGLASFGNLSVDQPGAKNLGTFSGGLAPAVSSSFTLSTYTITASAGANGGISPSDVVNVIHGADQTFTMTPNAGYAVSSILVDGTPSGSGASFTFDSVRANHTISVTFTPATLSITVQTSPPGLAITVDGIAYTSPQVFSWTANTTHSISTDSLQTAPGSVRRAWTGWSDAGARTHNVTPLVNTTYTASFKTQFLLTMSANTGGTVTPATGYQDSATFVQITGIPSSGYSFNSWGGSGPGSVLGGVNPGFAFMGGPIFQTANFTLNNVLITVGTNPPGRIFYVDNFPYSVAQTFSFLPGSVHSLSADSIQNSTGSARYIWSNWSDGDNRTHSFIVPSSNTTYTAEFRRQYFLTMNAGSGGTVAPASSWRDSAAAVPISATPTLGFSFSGWTGTGSGSFTGPNNPSSVTMNGPITETGSFTLFPVDVTINTVPAGRSYTVDGTTFTGSQTFVWSATASHTIAALSPQGDTLTRYVWTNWSDGGAQSHSVAPVSDTTFTVSFSTQHFLTMSAATGGTVLPASNWFNAGQVVPISAAAGTGFSFANWSGTGTGSYTGPINASSVTMNGPITETANFTPSSIQVTVTTVPAGRSIIVDGTTFTAPQTFTWLANTNHTIAADSIQDGVAGTRYVWSSWNDAGGLSHSVSSLVNTTFTASFATQYFLTMNTGTGGTVSPPSNWFASGSSVPITAAPGTGYSFAAWTGTGAGSFSGTTNPSSVTMNAPIAETANFTPNNIQVTVTTSPVGRSITVDGTVYTAPQTFTWVANTSHTIAADSIQNAAAGTRYAWAAWSDSGARSHAVSSLVNTTFTANFMTQYFLTMNTNVGGTVSPPSGWFNSSEPVNISAVPTSGFGFLNWNGSGVGSYSGGNNPGTLFMFGPITETANFAQNPNQVTVSTSPAGRAYRVNGSDYTTPQTFSVPSGNGLVVDVVTNPQPGPAGTRYDWASWSDSGAISHFFIPTSDTALVAVFRTQYLVTMNAGTGGTVSPATGWFNSGTSVPITATPNLSYSFSAWTGSGSGSYTGPANPSSVTVNGPITETGSFTLFPVQMTVQSDPPGRTVRVDGTLYTSPQTFTFTSGTVHTIAADSLQNGTAGTRYVWTDWSDSGARSHIVTIVKDTTFTVTLATQFFLTMNAGTGGTVAPASSWHDSASVVPISAAPGSGYTFAGWTGSGAGSYSGGANPANVSMLAPVTEAAAFSLGNIQVTVTTTPGGRSIIVDGTTYTAPQTFTWVANSNHTIATDSIQGATSSTRLAWAAWSDSGARVHSVSSLVNTTFTASFNTQYYLTMNTNTGGTVSPPSGWFNSGIPVQITATPASGFGFLNWNGGGVGSYSGGNNPGTLFMLGPITETANFAQNPHQVTVSTSPAGRSYRVNGSDYTTPQTFSVQPGNGLVVDIVTNPQPGTAGTRYNWASWSDGGAITHFFVPASDSNIVANFNTQYLVTMNSGAGGTVSPATGWFNSGTSVPITAAPNVGYSFSIWSGSGPGSYTGPANPSSVSVNGPITETGSFTLFPVEVTVQSNPPGRDVRVDGTLYTAPQTFTFTSGTAHTIGADSIQNGAAGTRYIWTNWSDSGARSHGVTVVKDTTFTVRFGTQFFLTMDAGTGGSVTPTSSWRDSASVVPISAAPGTGYSFTAWTGAGAGSYSGSANPSSVTMLAPLSESASFSANNILVTVTTSPAGRTIIVDGTTYTAPRTFTWVANSNHTIATDTIQNATAGTRYAWSAWSDSGAASHAVTPSVPSTITATFTTQHFLTMNTNVGGSVTPPSGWFDRNSFVMITAVPEEGYGFISWSGSGTGAYSGGGNPAFVVMGGPITQTANFGQNAVLVTVRTNPSGRTFYVDGNGYSSIFTFSFLPGSIHTISTDSIQSAAGGTRYLWTDWTDSAARTHIVEIGSRDTLFTARFKTQYGLTTSAAPAQGGTIDPPGQTFFDAGDTAAITAAPYTGYAFTSWSGAISTSANPTSLIMTSPKSVTANFAAGARITLQSAPPGRTIVVDDSTYVTPKVFNWLLNSVHTIGTTSPQQLGDTVRHIWTKWSDNKAISHAVTVTKDSAFTADFTTQYYLFTSAGSGGTISPSGGWHNAGDSVDITASPAAGYGFIEWQGTGTGSYTGANSASTIVMEGWIVQVATFGTLLPPPTLSGIPDGTTGLPPTPRLSWNAYAGATAYILQVATDSLFENTVYDSSTIADTSLLLPLLENKTTYYWRVKAKVGGNISTFSVPRHFATRPKSISPTLPAKTWVTRFFETVRWTSVDLTTPVNIRLSTNGGSTYTTILTDIPNTGSYTWRIADGTPIGNNSRIRIQSAVDSTVFGEAGPFVVVTGQLPLIVPLSTTIAFPSEPILSTFYRLVSSPGIVDSTERLSDILPGSPPNDWRMFWDNGAADNYLEELALTSTLGTGRGYWLLKKNDFSFVTNMTMPTLDSTNAAYAIQLHAGWNIIANPFDKNVSWAAALALNGLPGSTQLYSYGGAFVSAASLEPFKGYYFFNNTGLGSLKMPYPFGPAVPSAAFASDGWRVQLKLTSDINEDPDNFVGVSTAAEPGYDELDSHKPPLFLDQGFLYFNRPSWDETYSRFASDVRPAIGDGQTWEFEVAKTAGTKGTITFGGIDAVPSGYEVVLVNAYNSAPHDLRAHPEYAFTSVGPKMPFTLIIGTKDFVRSELEKQVPTSFELAQNFPNPFNPTTSISVSLPRDSEIRLDVFSILGQRVATLASGVYAQGVHTFVWEGTDQNRLPVSSGVYLYRLMAGDDLVQTKKMILTK